MKKALLSLVFTIMFTSFSFSQEKSLSKTEINEYFSKEIFNNFKKTNLELFNKLISSSLKKGLSENKEIIYSNFDNYYFFDNSEVILLGQLGKSEINVIDFTNQKNATSQYYTNSDGSLKVDEKSLKVSNSSGNTTANAAPCRDYPGFALCYTVTLAATASSGPLMGFTWGAGTAYCYYSHCYSK